MNEFYIFLKILIEFHENYSVQYPYFVIKLSLLRIQQFDEPGHLFLEMIGKDRLTIVVHFCLNHL